MLAVAACERARLSLISLDEKRCLNAAPIANGFAKEMADPKRLELQRNEVSVDFTRRNKSSQSFRLCSLSVRVRKVSLLLSLSLSLSLSFSLSDAGVPLHAREREREREFPLVSGKRKREKETEKGYICPRALLPAQPRDACVCACVFRVHKQQQLFSDKISSGLLLSLSLSFFLFLSLTLPHLVRPTPPPTPRNTLIFVYTRWK